MLLNEFFGSYNFKHSKSASHDEELKLKNEALCNDVLEYILNNDNLHKTSFFSIAEKVVREATKEHKTDLWMPLAEKGCLEFYKFSEMKEDPRKVFSKEFREDLCDRLAEHYQSDILKGVYNLGK
jgi:hypothetical protein